MTVTATACDLIFHPGGAMATQALTDIVFLVAEELTVLHLPSNGSDPVLLHRDEDYTIAGDGRLALGTITPLASWDAGERWYVERNTTFWQQRRIPTHGPLPAASLEAGLDDAVRMAQELKRRAGRSVVVPIGETAVQMPNLADRKGKYLAFDADGNPVPSLGMGVDSNLRADLALRSGAALSGADDGADGTDFTSVQGFIDNVRAFLRRWVFAEDYGYVGPWGNSAPAINAAIQAVKASGGDVILPNHVCRIDDPIIIGDGVAGTHSTYGAIRLLGYSAAAGIGAYNPLGGISIASYVAGPAIEVNGRLEGWGIEDLFIAFGTSDPAAIGLRVTEATRGYCPRMTIVNPPGGGVLLTTRNENNCESNVFPQLNIWLGTTYVNYGVKMTADGGGAVGNTSHNSFPDLVIIPGKSGQKCVWMQCCGTNYVENYACKSFDPTIDAMCFDYSVNDVWPVNNLFEKADWHGASITQIGAPNASVKAFGNRITGATQDNSARIPRLSGLTVERIKLATDTTFYVSNAGTDTGSVGLYAAGPWQTVQHAYDWIATQYDLNGYTATIKVAAGNYASLDAAMPCVGGTVVIDGAGGSTVFNGGASPVRARSGAAIKVSNVNLAPAVGPSLWADGGRIEVGAGVVFGAGTGYQDMLADAGGLIRITGNYFISDGATSHMEARAGGRIVSDAVTVTFIGDATFSTAFATARTGGVISTPGVTYTLGAYVATAPRYLADANGVIDVGGGAANFYPGNAAGTKTNGGQYV